MTGRHRLSSDWSARGPVAIVSLTSSVALALQAGAIRASRAGNRWGLPLFWLALLFCIVPSTAFLLGTKSGRTARLWVVALLAVTSSLIYRMVNPVVLSGYDEQLHVRTLNDIVHAHALEPNPLLTISSHFPGLEALTAFLHYSSGLPLYYAAAAVVVVSRVIFLLIVFSMIARWQQSLRVAGLAVAIYCCSQEFFFFNAQFAYQSLALTLAVAGVGLIAITKQTDSGTGRSLLAEIPVMLCLSATAVTHHATSWITTGFLFVWLLVEPPGPRRARLLLVGSLTVVVDAVWVGLNAGSLHAYFVPIASSVWHQATSFLTGTSQRTVFKDSSGFTTPQWERYGLLLYAAMFVLLSLTCAVAGMRTAIRMRSRPRFLIAVICLGFPITLALRVLPEGAQVGDRATTFVFLPMAALGAPLLLTNVARLGGRWPWLVRLSSPALVLAIAVGFVGGDILGGGADWERLPGSYLVAAEHRSMDSQTLAATAWAHASLPAGSRIAADRIGGALLSSRAGLWPITTSVKHDDPAQLFFDDIWTPLDTAIATRLKLEYIYIDTRWANSLPHVGIYFHNGENAQRHSPLAPIALSKFATLPGVRVAYRSGPIVIYDLRGLTHASETSGYTGGDRPVASSGVQIAVGLIAALLLILALRRRVRLSLVRTLRFVALEIGWPLVFAAILAGTVVASVVGVYARLSFGPAFSVALLVPLALQFVAVRLLHRSATGRPSVTVSLPAVLVVVVAVVVAVVSCNVAVSQARHAGAVQTKAASS